MNFQYSSTAISCLLEAASNLASKLPWVVEVNRLALLLMSS